MIVFIQCHKEPTKVSFSIYKTRGDYFTNIECEVREGKKIVDYGTIPTHHDTLYPARKHLINGYIADCHGIATSPSFSFSTLTLEKFISYGPSGADSLNKLGYIPDPFLEFYLVENGYYTYWNDTAALNDIIRKGELAIKFQKLK